MTKEKDAEVDEAPEIDEASETEETEDAQDAEETEAVDDVDAADAAEAIEEAEEAEEDEEADDEEDAGLRLKGKGEKKSKFTLRGRPWGAYLRRGALPALLVVSLAVSGFLGWRQWQAHQLNEAGEQARQAAIAYAGVLTSIDANQVDENFRQVLDGATGEFKDQYTQSSVQLRQLLIDNKATAHGTVVDSAIASESMNKVVVLLFIDQTVLNKSAPDPRIDRSRIKMTMEKVDGRWRAAKVQLL